MSSLYKSDFSSKIWGGGHLPPGVGGARPPGGKGTGRLAPSPSPPRRPGGARWATESRLRRRSHHAAFSRNFDVTHTWGEGAGRARGSGGGGGGRGRAAAVRGPPLADGAPASRPRPPGSLGPPRAPARSQMATPSQALPAAPPHLPPRGAEFSPFEIASCSQLREKLTPLRCRPVALIGDVRLNIAIAGRDATPPSSPLSLQRGRRGCAFCSSVMSSALTWTPVFYVRLIPPWSPRPIHYFDTSWVG